MSTFPLNHSVNNIDSVFFGDIEQGGLSINILIIKRQPMTQQQIQTLFFPLPTHVKQHSLLVIVFKVWVSAIVQ